MPKRRMTTPGGGPFLSAVPPLHGDNPGDKTNHGTGRHREEKNYGVGQIRSEDLVDIVHNETLTWNLRSLALRTLVERNLGENLPFL